MTTASFAAAASFAVQIVALWVAWRRADRFRLLALLVLSVLAARSILILSGYIPLPPGLGNFIGELAILCASLVLLVTGLRAVKIGTLSTGSLHFAFLDAIPLPVAIKSIDGRYSFVNRAFEQMFSMPLRHVIGRRAKDIWSSDIARTANDSDRTAVNELEVLHPEFSHADKDGKITHWIASKFPLLLDNQPPVIGIVYIDITERRKIEQRLAEQDERYKLAIHGTGIWDWDIVTDEMYLSPKFAALLGFGKGEVGTLSRSFIKTTIHPDDYDEYRKAIQQHFANVEHPFERELRYRTTSGSYRWFRLIGQAVLGPDGKPARFAGLVFDIDGERRAIEALRDSEARISSLLENSPSPIYFKDAQARFIMANRRYLDVHGLKLDDVLGKTSAQIYRGEAGRSYLAHDQEVIQRRKLIVRELNLGGITYLTAKFPVQLPDQTILGVAGIETDITERIAIENEVRRTKEAAEAANNTNLHKE
ncbi:MAG: PAS domain S-box protein [Proteobacteria bacterium]|nr:PAS domain S-box protein [Pseudomonadota bacterium]